MKTKKIITMALSLAMLSSVTVFAVSSASAADSSSNVEISVSDVAAKAGEEIAIPVNVNIPAPGIAGCEFSFTYDPSFLKVTGIKEGNVSGASGASAEELKKNADLADTMVGNTAGYSCLDYSIHDDKGEVAVMWATGLEDQSYWLSGDGQFITIMATVNADAKGSSEIGISAISRDGNKDIKFGYIDYSNNGEITYTVNATAGKVTIGDAAETTEKPEVTTTAKPDDKPTETTTAAEVTTIPVPDGVLLGDVNCDGTIDILDVTMLKQNIVKLVTLNDKQAANADTIHDGTVDVKDLGQLLKYIIKVIDKF